MGIVFGTLGDDIGVTNAALDDITTGTALAWVFPTSSAAFAPLMDRADIIGFTWYSTFSMFGSGGTGDITFQMHRATTDLNVRTTTAGTSLSAWNFVGAQWNSGGVNADQKLYWGNRTNLVAEVGAYSLQTVGAGAITSDSGGTQHIGGSATSGVLVGTYGVLGVWNRTLSLDEIRAQQFHPFKSDGMRLYYHIGYNGGSSVSDYSGNGADGTVVNSPALGDHPPLGAIWGFDDEEWQDNPPVPGHTHSPSRSIFKLRGAHWG